MSVVIDASAILAILQDELGGEYAYTQARGALLSTVTYSEVLVKISDKGLPIDRFVRLLAKLELMLVPFGEAEARAAAAIRPQTRGYDISFGDRACLSLALERGLPLLNCDHDWAKLDLGIELWMIRERR